MKIFVPNYQPERIGGGWTWTRYFVEHFGQSSYEECDVYLIPSASMVSRDEVIQAKKDGKKIVLRTDNVIRNSRNRNTGMTRMKDFCELADLVIYQSQWAKDFLLPYTQTNGIVILNGVDTNKYTNDNKGAEDTYLYVRSSRDEGKQWIMAWYWFVNNPGHLEIVGKFSHDNLEYNFDFFNGERYRFMGEQTNMPDVYKRNKYFLYTYTCDACSNTLIEALFSGCEIIDVFNSLTTGGAPEIMEAWKNNKEILTIEYMAKRYLEEMRKIV